MFGKSVFSKILSTIEILQPHVSSLINNGTLSEGKTYIDNSRKYFYLFRIEELGERK